jgi:membrane associated rhomboid family serine protease
MPLSQTKPRKQKDESISELLRRTNLQDFQRKSILFGFGTVLGALVWFAFRDEIPFQVAGPVVGAMGIEAAKNIRRWIEWRQSRSPADLVHPDRITELQQETVKVMSDAVKARAWFTRGIVGCIAIPSILELFVGVNRAVEVASVEPEAVFSGQWWRLLGGTYLHGSYYHFAGNMSALFLYGSILESKTSRVRLPLVYLLSALGGSYASVLTPPDVPSIGASGGVVGVIAYLFLFSRRQEVKFPAAFRGATASVFVGLITAGALGFWYIDNPGHAGGAITGLVLAALLVDPARNFGDESSEPLVDMLGWIAVAVLIAGAVVTSQALLGH